MIKIDGIVIAIGGGSSSFFFYFFLFFAAILAKGRGRGLQAKVEVGAHGG